nr:MAG TPA: hypothetical protein [Caudoviricetes sp.]
MLLRSFSLNSKRSRSSDEIAMTKSPFLTKRIVSIHYYDIYLKNDIGVPM